MSHDNWDDPDFSLPAPNPTPTPTPAAAPNFDDDDLFEFTETLQILDNDQTPPPTPKSLPPLPPDTQDLSNDRGILLHISKSGAGTIKPSKEAPFIEIHYQGFLLSSTEPFDSSREQNYPLVVQLDIPPSGKSTLIPGLEHGLRHLRQGDIATLTIASKYAYGKNGTQDIPPDSDLRFEVEVLDVRPTQKRVVKVDSSKNDLSRLDDIRREREKAQARREEEQAAKEDEKRRKAQRAAQLREKLANKNKGPKKGGKKKK